ncbi:MAG: hypothetical protein IJ777_03145 [Clostridia bacterium]|nr:hypothetical protein [Clostridia bacterium]
MKAEKILKIVLTVLVIILISLVSFGGIFVKNTKFVESVIPEYQLGMDLKGTRSITMEINDSTKTVYYDKDGNIVSQEGENTTAKEEPINSKDSLTKENYEKTKQLIEQRLKQMNVQDFIIRQDETTGKLFVQLTENDNTDLFVQYMAIKGSFTVVNDDGDVLLTNSDIKNAQVGYRTTNEGTAVYLTINFNKEGQAKLKDISNTYVKTTDEEGNATTKKVTLKIDDSTLLSTYFQEEIANGVIQMSIGQSTTDVSTIQSYLQEASNLAVLLNTGEMPLTYSITANKYVKSDITIEMLSIPAIILLVIIVVALLALVVKYRKNGLLVAICHIGYAASLLLVIRYTNVVITIEGIAGLLISFVMNYIFSIYLLNLLQKNKEEGINLQFREATLKSLLILIPATIIAVTLCFSGWLPIFSFGTTLFWGLMTCAIYNVVITRTLLVNAGK